MILRIHFQHNKAGTCKSDLPSIFFLSSMFFRKLKRKWHDSSVALNSSFEMGGVSPINWFN